MNSNSKFLSQRWLAMGMIFAASVVACGTRLARADEAYPAKPIRLIVAYAAGGGTDIMARLVGEQLGRRLNQSVIVENRSGGGGIIGAQTVADAAPDGYTLLFTAIAELTIANLSTPNVPYKLSDFSPVGRIALSPFALLVNKDLPVKTVSDLVSYAAHPPTPMSMSAPANYSYLTGGLFKLQTHLNMPSIRYRGSAPAMTDLVGGHVQLGFDTIAISLPQAKSGNVRMLAVASDKRSLLAPDVPTMAESGYPAVIGGAWYGLVAPKGVPTAVTQRLQQAISAMLQSSDFTQKLAEQGFDPYLNDTPAAFEQFLKDDSAKWQAVAEKVGF